MAKKKKKQENISETKEEKKTELKKEGLFEILGLKEAKETIREAFPIKGKKK
jgi:hypothetical protein